MGGLNATLWIIYSICKYECEQKAVTIVNVVICDYITT